MTLLAFVRQIFLNSDLWPDLEFEILTETEQGISFRMNSPQAEYLGENSEMLGMGLGDFNRAWYDHAGVIGDRGGCEMTREVEDSRVRFTVKTR